MTTTRFQVRAIDPAVAARLRQVDDVGRPPRHMVDREGGSPLWCCLRDSEPGERLALVSYAPLRRWAVDHGVDPGPYDEVGPIFLHAEPCAGWRPGSGFPDAHRDRLRVFRAYSRDGRIVGGRLVGPAAGAVPAESVLAELFADAGNAVIHVRTVVFGCFLFEVRRPQPLP